MKTASPWLSKVMTSSRRRISIGASSTSRFAAAISTVSGSGSTAAV
ncbi:hypothetical protein [Streptomyces sp. NPDC008265]